MPVFGLNDSGMLGYWCNVKKMPRIFIILAIFDDAVGAILTDAGQNSYYFKYKTSMEVYSLGLGYY